MTHRFCALLYLLLRWLLTGSSTPLESPAPVRPLRVAILLLLAGASVFICVYHICVYLWLSLEVLL